MPGVAESARGWTDGLIGLMAVQSGVGLLGLPMGVLIEPLL